MGWGGGRGGEELGGRGAEEVGWDGHDEAKEGREHVFGDVQEVFD